MDIACRDFGTAKSGEKVLEYKLTNGRGMAVTVLDYGCTITSITVPDRGGRPVDVCLGYDTLAEYEENSGYFGALVGRHANRLGGGRFTLNGREYRLACNNGPNHLHGGLRGFDKYVWQTAADGDGLCFSRVSPDGEEGYPGDLTVRVRFSLSDDNALMLAYEAETDADTVVNLTNHSYFNLHGHASGSIYTQRLQVFADAFTENDDQCLPTGRILPVRGTPFDFTYPKCIGLDIDADDVNLRNGHGYDHNFVLRGKLGEDKKAALLFCDETGIAMETDTTLPGVQIYSANFVTPRAGKRGAQYDRRHAVCLETQLFPNAMLCTDFPSPVLRAGQRFFHTTTYRFTNF